MACLVLSTRLAVHKQSFLNLQSQNGCHVTKVYKFLFVFSFSKARLLILFQEKLKTMLTQKFVGKAKYIYPKLVHGRPPTKIGKPVVRITAPRSLETNRTKMATVSWRCLARSKKDYFVAVRSTLKRMGVLRRSRHTECKVELEIGNQWVSEYLIFGRVFFTWQNIFELKFTCCAHKLKFILNSRPTFINLYISCLTSVVYTPQNNDIINGKDRQVSWWSCCCWSKLVTFDNIVHTARAYYFTQIVECVELCGSLTECNSHAVVTF